mmetsp:Transcript_24496/g.61414  ORF Transcript_24496/g.61414 Transcript_24496/m.61414 type:complete len:341 (+) Transcript_24496:225-1247(+)
MGQVCVCVSRHIELAEQVRQRDAQTGGHVLQPKDAVAGAQGGQRDGGVGELLAAAQVVVVHQEDHDRHLRQLQCERKCLVPRGVEAIVAYHFSFQLLAVARQAAHMDGHKRIHEALVLGLGQLAGTDDRKRNLLARGAVFACRVGVEPWRHEQGWDGHVTALPALLKHAVVAPDALANGLVVQGHQLAAAGPGLEGVVVGGVNPPALRVDAGQTVLVVRDESLGVHSLQLHLRHGGHVPRWRLQRVGDVFLGAGRQVRDVRQLLRNPRLFLALGVGVVVIPARLVDHALHQNFVLQVLGRGQGGGVAAAHLQGGRQHGAQVALEGAGHLDLLRLAAVVFY